MNLFPNPFRPGAGQMPPHLAGRNTERNEFEKLLDQRPNFQNLIITGLKGVGKTVFLGSLKPLAAEKNWLWCYCELNEAVSS